MRASVVWRRSRLMRRYPSTRLSLGGIPFCASSSGTLRCRNVSVIGELLLGELSRLHLDVERRLGAVAGAVRGDRDRPRAGRVLGKREDHRMQVGILEDAARRREEQVADLDAARHGVGADLQDRQIAAAETGHVRLADHRERGGRHVDDHAVRVARRPAHRREQRVVAGVYLERRRALGHRHVRPERRRQRRLVDAAAEPARAGKVLARQHERLAAVGRARAAPRRARGRCRGRAPSRAAACRDRWRRRGRRR